MSSKNVIKFSALILVLTILTAGFSYAQRLTGKITGVVTDDEGIPIPGVSVEISSPALLGGVKAQATSEKGTYRFLNLPPGIYKLVFKIEGFQTLRRENLRVSLASTVTENISLKPVTIEESITVTAESPIVDVESSTTSTMYDKDQIENLPSGRFTYFAIIKQNPGFTTSYGEASSRISAFGSNSEENAMYLDGVDLSNPEIGTAWLWPTADMFEEVEVTGLGAPAEYGNFTGAVVNVVSKSGGNNFSGTAAYYRQFDALTDDNNPDTERWESYHRDRFYDISFTLGGPIIKDKIWFFGMYQKQVDSQSWWQDDPAFPSEYKGDEQFFKLSAQVANKHRLVLSFDREYGYYPDSPDAWNLPETITAETDLSYAWNFHYTWLASDSVFFELKYSGYYSPNDMMPAFGGDINQPVHYDGATSVSSNGPWWPWEYIVTLNKINASVSYFAEDFLAGDHDFKLGVQLSRGTSEAWGAYGGGKYYYDYAGEPYILYEYNVWRYGGTVNSIGTFVDDSWKVGDRLTLNLGLRFDHHYSFIPAFPIMDGWVETSEKGPKIEDLIVWNSLSPRIGLAYQLTPDQKTLLKASFGRYYTYPYIANWEWPGPNMSDWVAYYWTGTEWEWWYTIEGGQGYRVDENLKNPRTDQFSIGLERELFPDFSVGMTYVYKNQVDNIAYVNAAGIYEEVQRVSPDNGQTYTAYNQTNFPSEDHLLTNPEDFGQTYNGLILQLNKRYSHNWLLNASFTYSKAEGLNMSSGASSGSYSSSQSLAWYTGKFGVDPNELINAKGVLNLDRRWSLKVSAAYNFPLDILLSTNLTYQQGRPRKTFVRIYDLNQRPGGKPFTIIADPPGTERFDDMLLVDLRLQKTFRVYKTLKFHAFADVFNLFNDDTFYRFRSFSLWSTAYNVPMYMPDPRRVQVGVKLEF
jgi:outer membrane receptor protein involved in Fe transport